MRLDTVHNSTHRRMAAAVSAVICAVPAVLVTALVIFLVLVAAQGCGV